jgi:hypothetical protein
VTRGQTYPVAEVNEVIAANGAQDTGISDEQARRTVEEAVDSSDVIRIGEGMAVVYAYGYRGYPDRLKVGSTVADTVQRIAAQIGTSTPDEPILHLEIKTNDCRVLERAIQAILEARGRKVAGGGDEWFKASRDEILAIYEFIQRS